MNTLKKNELYQNLQEFLSSKGIELSDGGIAKGIKQGCELLTDAINVTQHAVGKAKTEVDAKLDRMRRVIHEKTAPRDPSAPPPEVAPDPKAKVAKKKSARRRTPARSGVKESATSDKPRTVARKPAKKTSTRKRTVKKSA